MQFSTQYDLYLGRHIGNIGHVHGSDFDSFLAEHVTDRFPGYTLTDAKGYWLGVPEPTLILTILGNSLDKSSVDWIARAYRTHFGQSAVLIVQTAIVGALV